MNPKTHKAAFTLIELIAVMAVMVVAFAISVPMFVQNSSDVAARQAAFDVGSTIRLAREWAIVNGVSATFFVPDYNDDTLQDGPTNKFNDVMYPDSYFPADGAAPVLNKDPVASRRCLTSYTVYAGNSTRGELVSTWKSLPKGLYFSDLDTSHPNCPDGRTSSPDRIKKINGEGWETSVNSPANPKLGDELTSDGPIVPIRYQGRPISVRGVTFHSDGSCSDDSNVYLLITPGMSSAESLGSPPGTGGGRPEITYFKGEPGEKGLTGCAIRVKSFTGAVDYYPFAHK